FGQGPHHLGRHRERGSWFYGGYGCRASWRPPNHWWNDAHGLHQTFGRYHRGFDDVYRSCAVAELAAARHLVEQRSRILLDGGHDGGRRVFRRAIADRYGRIRSDHLCRHGGHHCFGFAVRDVVERIRGCHLDGLGND